MTTPNEEQQPEQDSPVQSEATSGQGGLAEGGEHQPDQPAPSDSSE